MSKVFKIEREKVRNFYLKRLVVNSLLILLLFSMIFVFFRELKESCE
jgi:hypothetical protein